MNLPRIYFASRVIFIGIAVFLCSVFALQLARPVFESYPVPPPTDMITVHDHRGHILTAANGNLYDALFIDPSPSSLLAAVAASSRGKHVLVLFTADISIHQNKQYSHKMVPQFSYSKKECGALTKLGAHIVTPVEPQGCAIDWSRLYESALVHLNLRGTHVLTNVRVQRDENGYIVTNQEGSVNQVTVHARKVIDDSGRHFSVRPCASFLSINGCRDRATASIRESSYAVELPCHNGVAFFSKHADLDSFSKDDGYQELQRLLPGRRQMGDIHLCYEIPWSLVIPRAQLLSFYITGSTSLVSLAGNNPELSEERAQEWVLAKVALTGIGGDILYRWYWRYGESIADYLVFITIKDEHYAERLIKTAPVALGEVLWQCQHQYASSMLDAVLRTGVCQAMTQEDCYLLFLNAKNAWPKPPLVPPCDISSEDELKNVLQERQ